METKVNRVRANDTSTSKNHIFVTIVASDSLFVRLLAGLQCLLQRFVLLVAVLVSSTIQPLPRADLAMVPHLEK